MEKADLGGLVDEFLASCDGFNRKDVSAWLDPFHDDAVTYNKGFFPVSMVRPMADAMLASSKSFNVDNVEGRIVDDTAILFGNFRFELNDGQVDTGKFSATCVRTGGEWKTLMTHYTPD